MDRVIERLKSFSISLITNRSITKFLQAREEVEIATR